MTSAINYKTCILISIIVGLIAGWIHGQANPHAVSSISELPDYFAKVLGANPDSSKEYNVPLKFTLTVWFTVWALSFLSCGIRMIQQAPPATNKNSTSENSPEMEEESDEMPSSETSRERELTKPSVLVLALLSILNAANGLYVAARFGTISCITGVIVWYVVMNPKLPPAVETELHHSRMRPTKIQVFKCAAEFAFMFGLGLGLAFGITWTRFLVFIATGLILTAPLVCLIPHITSGFGKRSVLKQFLFVVAIILSTSLFYVTVVNKLGLCGEDKSKQINFTKTET